MIRCLRRPWRTTVHSRQHQIMLTRTMTVEVILSSRTPGNAREAQFEVTSNSPLEINPKTKTKGKGKAGSSQRDNAWTSDWTGDEHGTDQQNGTEMSIQEASYRKDKKWKKKSGVQRRRSPVLSDILAKDTMGCSS